MTAFDDLALLRSFVCIVECGSISDGARRLKMSQPTLGRRLRMLEEKCGATLLRRDTHHLGLTPQGQRLLADAQLVLAHAEKADQRFRDDKTSFAGHLCVFASIDLGQSIVTRLLSRFLQNNPQVTAELVLSSRPFHMIEEGCDVGIVPGKITDDSVVARPAGKIALRLFASRCLVDQRAVVQKPADLESWPWIGVAGLHFWNTRAIKLLAANGAEKTLHVSPVLISESVTSIREAVRAGLGVALIPEFLVREDVRSRRLVRLLSQWKPKAVPVHVVYDGRRMQPLRVRAFIDFALTFLAKELGTEL